MQPPAPMFQNQHQESIQSATKFRPSLPPTAALSKPVSKPVWWEIRFFKCPWIFPVGKLKTLGTPDRAPLRLEEDEFEEWTKVRMNNNSVHLRNQDPEAEQRKCETLCQDDKLPQLNNAEIPCVQTDHQNMPSNVLLWGTACKQPFKVSLDTGAAITVISEKFFVEVLRAYFAIQKSERIDNIKTAYGSKVPVIGLVRFPLILGDNEYSCNAMIVPGLAYSIALGRDFLYNKSAVIDVKVCFVTFHGSNIIYFLKGDKPLIISDVKTVTSYVLDAQSEKIIPARLENLCQVLL